MNIREIDIGGSSHGSRPAPGRHLLLRHQLNNATDFERRNFRISRDDMLKEIDFTTWNWAAETADDRFSLLRKLAETFTDLAPEQYGYSSEQVEGERIIASIDDRCWRYFGKPKPAVASVLPLALRNWYRSVGRVYELTSVHNKLIAPAKLASMGSMMIIYVENQHCTFWAIRLDDLDQDDPPVYFFDEYRSDWLRESDTVSEFALMVGLFELCTGGGNRISGRTSGGFFDEGAASILHENLVKLPIDTFKTCQNPDDAFLAGRTFIAMLWGGPDFMFVLNGSDKNRMQIDDMIAPKKMHWDD